MSGSAYTLWTSVHGLLAALAWALLLHPIVFLRGNARAGRAAQRTAAAASLLLLVVFALGSWVYPTYRGAVKPWLVHTDAPSWVWFERKEHLAVLAVATAAAGAGWLWGLPEHPRGGRRLLTVAWCLLSLVVALGLGVRASVHPGWSVDAVAE